MTGWTAFFSIAFGFPLAICLPVIALREFFYLHPLQSWEWEQWQMLLLFFIGSILAFASGILILLTAVYVALKIIRDIRDEKVVVVGASPIENADISQVAPSPVSENIVPNSNIIIGEGEIERVVVGNFFTRNYPLSNKDKTRESEILAALPGCKWKDVINYIESSPLFEKKSDNKGIYYSLRVRKEIDFAKEDALMLEISVILMDYYQDPIEWRKAYNFVRQSYPIGFTSEGLNYVKANFKKSESITRVRREEAIVN